MKGFFLLVFFGLSTVHGFPEEPWEPSEVHTIGCNSFAFAAPKGGALEDIALGMIRFYQTEVSPRSVKRCPFLISCSNFAATAIRDKGLLFGLVVFLDRYYYRENVAAFSLYKLVIVDGYTLKIDDREYLE
jgi:hypothetical protein